MIIKMKHLDLICVAAEKDATLTALRELGLAHLDLTAAQGAAVASAKGEAADAERAVRAILKARADLKKAGTDVTTREPLAVADALKVAASVEESNSSAESLAREIAHYAPYGDFDPELAQKLLDKGIDLSSVCVLPEKLPRKRLSALEADKAACEKAVQDGLTRLASGDEAAILASFPALSDRIAFAAAEELMAESGAVAYISGWVPVTLVEKLDGAVKSHGWGVLLRDPEPGETPPTLVEPPKIFRPMKALFAGLGIAPAYTEADVSVPFMCYFSLFFAMLVGDGAYGAIFLIGTLLARKKLPKSWFILLTVFSSSTVVWGILSNTWFGASIPALACLPTVEWLADPSYHNMMLLCFTIGASHLILARVWNGICKLPDSTAIAEFGWAGVLLFMYLVTNSIVGIFSGIPTWAYVVFGVSLVALFGFSVKPSQLKAHGAELGMLPLNIMSALGDIISYVRLFAVGLASVQVAVNFNQMATGLFSDGQSIVLQALLAVAMVLILLIGHGLNLAMAALSVLVHAVRLNTLEFSNHKGVSWSGYAFRAFARQAK